MRSVTALRQIQNSDGGIAIDSGYEGVSRRTLYPNPEFLSEPTAFGNAISMRSNITQQNYDGLNRFYTSGLASTSLPDVAETQGMLTYLGGLISVTEPIRFRGARVKADGNGPFLN